MNRFGYRLLRKNDHATCFPNAPRIRVCTYPNTNEKEKCVCVCVCVCVCACRSRAANSIVRGGIWPKFKRVHAFMHGLSTCTNEKDPFSN